MNTSKLYGMGWFAAAVVLGGVTLATAFPPAFIGMTVSLGFGMMCWAYGSRS